MIIKEMFLICVLNGFAGAISFTVIHTYISNLLSKQSLQSEKIDYLYQKIASLEKHVNDLQNVSEQIQKKELVQDTLQIQLEEFINTQYEIVE